MNEGEGIFQEVNVLKGIKAIGKKSKVTQAKILQRLETVIDDPQEFAEIRKFILDEINSLTRGCVKEVFGNVEFLIK